MCFIKMLQVRIIINKFHYCLRFPFNIQFKFLLYLKNFQLHLLLR